MSNKFKLLFIVLLFFIIGFSVYAVYNKSYNDVEQITAQVTETSAVVTTETTTRTTTESSTTTTHLANTLDFDNSIDLDDIPIFDEWDTVGYITCDSAGLYKVPITYGWAQNITDGSEIVLGEYEGVLFGQNKGLFLCGHNYKAFKNLKNAEIGDKIIIETTYGANFEYIITCSEKSLLIQPNDEFKGIKKLKSDEFLQKEHEDDNVLGLFTCCGPRGSDYRWYVGSRLVRGTNITY